jgi:hypothetical protein
VAVVVVARVLTMPGLVGEIEAFSLCSAIYKCAEIEEYEENEESEDDETEEFEDEEPEHDEDEDSVTNCCVM